MITKEHLDAYFNYHAPQGDDQGHYSAMGDAFRIAAEAIVNHTPPSAEQTLAIRKLQEARMWANAAVAIVPHLPKPAPRPIDGLGFTITQVGEDITFDAHYHKEMLCQEIVRKQDLMVLANPRQALDHFVDKVQKFMKEVHGVNCDRDQVWYWLSKESDEMAKKFRMPG